MLLILLGIMYNAYYYASQDVTEQNLAKDCLSNNTCYQVSKGEGKDRYYEILYYGVEYERYGVRFSSPEQEKQVLEARRKDYSEKYRCFQENTCELIYHDKRIILIPTKLNKECICQNSCYIDKDSGKIIRLSEAPIRGSYMVFEIIKCESLD